MEKQKEGIRLNKMLSESGVCSRREADRLVEAGRVFVDGKKAVAGMRVLPGQKVICDGKEAGGRDKPVLLAVNKPRGIVCTTSDRDRAENIVDFLKYPVRVYPVGRLDKDSEGLLLMTNQGALVNDILKSRNGHEKEYLVTVDKPVTDDFLKKMGQGVAILDTVTKPCRVEKAGEKSFRIILTQGLNRQIRRMCEALGYQVKTLKRTRIMNIELGNLKTGEHREISKKELAVLKKTLADKRGSGQPGEKKKGSGNEKYADGKDTGRKDRYKRQTDGKDRDRKNTDRKGTDKRHTDGRQKRK